MMQKKLKKIKKNDIFGKLLRKKGPKRRN